MGDRAETPGSTLLKGAAVLGAAAAISKLLGTLQKIPLQNVAGDQTYGIYSAVYPYYILILFLATAGFPVAVSKFVSERAARDDPAGAERVLYVSSILLSFTGLGAFCLLFFGAGWIAVLIDNMQTEPAIRSVSFALLLVPLMSALRGYSQGYQDMVPTGVSQVAEQFVRVGTMLLLLYYFVSADAASGVVAAGQTFGSVTGAAAGLAVMLFYWRKRKIRQRPAGGAAVKPSFLPLAGRILLYALPVCMGAIVVPILNIVDTFTMPRLLKQQGFDESEAMRWFGVYARGLTLVQLVSMLASSLSVALVPAIAAAKAKGQWSSIRMRGELSVRLTWVVGAAASAGLAFAAAPINIMLYKDAAGTEAMTILSLTAVFSALNIISAGILQGMGFVLAPALNLCFAAVLKWGLNMALMPLWGIDGAAASAVLAFAAACALNLMALRRRTGIRFPLGRYVYKPAAALAVMIGCLYLSIHGVVELLRYGLPSLSVRAVYTPAVCISVLVSAAVYGAALFRFGAVSAEDLAGVPRFNDRWLPRLRKWRLLGKPPSR